MRIKKSFIKQKKQVNCKFTCFFRERDVTGLGYNKTARRWPCGLLMVEMSTISAGELTLLIQADIARSAMEAAENFSRAGVV